MQAIKGMTMRRRELGSMAPAAFFGDDDEDDDAESEDGSLDWLK